MVGRERELEAGARFLAAIRHGPGCLILEGEAGIGKTTIWRELVSRAQTQGCRVLSCRPAEAEAKLSFAALADLLSNVDRQVLASLPQPQRHGLEVALLEAPPGPRPPDRRAVFAGLSSTLSALADEDAVLIAVDDLQWLDRSSQAALEFALRRLADRAVGLLCCLRVSETTGLAPGLERVLTESNPERIRLEPLSIGALHGLLAERLGLHLPRPTLVRIAESARGNPFHALEMGRELARRGTLAAGQALPIPDDLSQLLGARIRRLPRATRNELLAAAALSNPLLDLLDVGVLEPAENAGVIEIGAERLSFSHPLLAAAVYASASTSARRGVHRRLAGIVSDPEERARHLALSAEGVSEATAAELDRAARLAGSRGAPDAAAELFELAARLTPPESQSVSGRALAAAECHFHAGDRTRARSLTEEVLRSSTSAPVRGRALQILGEVRYHEDSYAAAIPLFEEALTLLGDEPEAVELHVNLGIVRWHLGGTRAQAEHAQAAVELAERLGDSGLLAVALASLVIAEFYLNRPLDRARLEQALKLEDPDRPLLMPLRPSLIGAALEFFSDNLDRAASLLYALRQRTIDRGEDSDLPNLDANLSAVEFGRGDLSKALDFANEGCEISLMLGSAIGQADNLGQRCFVRAALGDVDGARTDAAAASLIAHRADVGQAAVWLAAALAFLELSLGDPHAAHRAFQPVAGMLEPAGDCEPYLATLLPDWIETLIAVGELQRGQALTESLERHGRIHDRASVLARAARCRALLAAALGDLAAARAEMKQALSEHSRLHMPLELGRTLLAMGQIERRAKQKRAARESFEHALAAFEQIGAPLWGQRARVELERTGARHTPGDELTPTELRVAELAADGLTNRQIAETVFVSAKTVEANLARIYLKLGIRSRAELGRAMADRGRSRAVGAGTSAAANPVTK